MDTPDSTSADLRRQNSDLLRELAERTAERDEVQAQKDALGDVLEVINSSPGNLAPVFDAMLEKAMRLCDAAFGTLAIFDGGTLRTAATRGVPQDYARFRMSNPPVYGPKTAPGRFMAGERLIHNIDLKAEEAYLEGEPNRRALVDLGGARTALQVALRKDDALLGSMTLYRQEVRPFTDKQIGLLGNFAAQAVIAMENARLLTETREALEQQTATAEVLGVINASPGNLQPVFEAILEKALGLCEAAFGSLAQFDGDAFDWLATHGVPEAWFAEFSATGYRPTPGLALYRFQHSGDDIEHVVDIAADETGRSAIADRHRFVELTGARTAIWIALRKDRALRGALVIYRREVRPFTAKQIALLQSFAAQAVVAMENARLITETREALEQQTATAEVLQVINSSPGDLAPVFEAILDKAHSLCGIAFGSLQLYEEGKVRAVAVRAVAEDLAELLRQPMTPSPGSAMSRLIAGERFVQNTDIAELAEYAPHDPRIRLSAARGLRTGLFVPLRKEARLLGYISAFRDQVRPFSDKEIMLLESFAAQAVIAMENARLITETREALEQQTATAEVLGVINASPGDLAPVFDTMLEKAMRLCEATGGALRSYDGAAFHVAAMRGMPEAFATATQIRVPHTGTALGRIERGEHIVHIEDLTDPTRPVPHRESRREMLEVGGIRTALWVALRKDEELLGTFVLYRSEVRPFAEKQIALVENFAQQAVIAMENARLLGELRRRTEEVAELNRGLEARVAEQVDELGRVGRLKRFLAPQLAELIVSQGDENILESHRREIVVVFCDLRGYTAFTETAEPEEVLDFLREYHGALGPLVAQFEGTLDQFSGDGIMVFFNDPVPIPDAAERAVNMAVAMREVAATLIAAWRERGRELGFGVGIAQGYATLGQIGFSDRSGYTAIGTVCNVAARLCAEAKDGQILLAQRVNVALKGSLATEQVGALTLKGLTQPVVAYNVSFVAARPRLHVIEGSSP